MGFSSQFKVAEIPRISSSSPWKSRKSGQYHMRLHGFALSDGRISEFGQFPFTSILLVEYPDDGFIEMGQTFEPQVNSPALLSTLVIAIVFGFLQLRIKNIGQAAIRRNDALKSLREIKAAQLGPADDPKRPSADDVRAAVADYEMALNEELSLRTIIPGVRIVAPNDPKSKEEDVAAAKQFLGRDLKDDDRDEDQSNVVRQPDEERKRLLLQSRRRFDGKTGSSSVDKNDAEEGISNSAKAVLLLVALSQIVLLIILSVDPMTAGDTLTSIFGNSPLDII
mmetsp:Transcript_6085/g.7065  ORF Transcript_6085/g.7065 Transcript_6085/m.7065 type:complete len:281 (+) Transcript_6085:77-919(+)